MATKTDDKKLYKKARTEYLKLKQKVDIKEEQLDKLMRRQRELEGELRRKLELEGELRAKLELKDELRKKMAERQP